MENTNTTLQGHAFVNHISAMCWDWARVISEGKFFTDKDLEDLNETAQAFSTVIGYILNARRATKAFPEDRVKQGCLCLNSNKEVL